MINQSTVKKYFKCEYKYIQQGYDFVIGVDEAGRGPLAGPVVACAAAVIRHSEFRSKRNEESIKKRTGNKRNRSFTSTWVEAQDDELFGLIKDSKLMTEKRREELYDFICEHFHVGIGICDHKTIDRINILEATFLAMKSAVSQLKSKIKNPMPTGRQENEKLQFKNKNLKNTRYKIPDIRCIILVDGNRKIPNFSHIQKAVVNGDRIVKSISASSVIAKVTRDRIMHEMDKRYPQYGFSRHKGYGTKSHRKMIKKYGLCEIHRKSFKVK